MALPDYPKTRTEEYLHRIATDSGRIPDEPHTRIECYLDYIAVEGVGGIKTVDDLPMDPAEIKPKSLYHLTEDVEHGGVPYEKGMYYYDTVTGTWVKLGDAPDTGPMFLGLVDQTTTAFPTARPGGGALVNGDYVKVSADAVLPFTIGDITFNNPKDQAVWLGDEWVLNANAFQKTDETPLKDKVTESMSGTASMQDVANKQFKKQFAHGDALPSGEYEGQWFTLDVDIEESSGVVKKGIYRFNGSTWHLIANYEQETIVFHTETDTEVEGFTLPVIPNDTLTKIYDAIIEDTRSVYVANPSDEERYLFINAKNDGTDTFVYMANGKDCLVEYKSSDGTNADILVSKLGSEYDFVSLRRLGEYLFEVTFDDIPEYKPLSDFVSGGCSAFVKDGKLYRTYDWNYDNTAEFLVKTKNFEGIAMIQGLDDGSINLKKVGQTPYHMVDGINTSGIRVSTHVLYNDFSYAGSGDKSKSITQLPYYILDNVTDISNLSTDLADYLANMGIPEALADMEYLLQILVTDGTTTYVVTPPETAGGTYSVVDATSNPKLTNFRWVSDATVARTALQNRPNGVERWNEINEATTLADLRFTKAYEAPTRLSEFIGEAGTTKDSTDAELEAVYDIAHAKYLTRTRNGELWQTVHAVVYGDNGMEHLFVQENFEKDYIGSSECYRGDIASFDELPNDVKVHQIFRLAVDIPVVKFDDLTDKTWIANATIDIPEAFTKNVTFTTDATLFSDCEGIRVRDDAQSVEYQRVEDHDFSVAYYSGHWGEEDFRVVHFTGGDDITDEDFINWVRANGVIVGETHLPKGACIVSEKDDPEPIVDGVNWTLLHTEDVEETEFDNKTIDKDIFGRLEVKNEGITNIQINPELKATDINSNSEYATHDKLATEKAVSLARCYRGDIASLSDLPSDIKKGHIYRLTNDVPAPEVTNLTNQTWHANDTIVDLEAMTKTLNFIMVDEPSVPCAHFRTTSASIEYDIGGIIGYVMVYTDTSGWSVEKYKTLKFTGGDDVADSDLIELLKNNGTFTSTIAVPKGACIVAQVDDPDPIVDGTNWVLLHTEEIPRTDVDDETIDFNSAGQLEVKAEGIANSHIDPELKATDIHSNSDDATDDKLATEKAVSKARTYRGETSVIPASAGVKKGHAFRVVDNLTGKVWSASNSVTLPSSYTTRTIGFQLVSDPDAVCDFLGWDPGINRIFYHFVDGGSVTVYQSGWKDPKYKNIRFTGTGAVSDGFTKTWLRDNGTLSGGIEAPDGTILLALKDNPTASIDNVNWTLLYTEEGVQSVNSKTGRDIVLEASDIMAADDQSVQQNLERIDERIDDLDTEQIALKDATVESLDGTSTTQNEANAELVTAIKTMRSKVDVVDIVNCYDRGTDTTKTDIVHYDTSVLTENDIVKVLKDETHSNQISYYKFDGSVFTYIGSEQSADVDDVTIGRNNLSQLEVKDHGISLGKLANQGAANEDKYYRVGDDGEVMLDYAVRKVLMTQAEYDALEEKDPRTFYLITDPDTPAPAAIGNGEITFVSGSTAIGSFTTNQSTDGTIELPAPVAPGNGMVTLGGNGSTYGFFTTNQSNDKTFNNIESTKYKKTSWSSTPSDTNYPSEKLVKDNLDTLNTRINNMNVSLGSFGVANRNDLKNNYIKDRAFSVCGVQFVSDGPNSPSDPEFYLSVINFGSGMSITATGSLTGDQFCCICLGTNWTNWKKLS